jgi:hypothetical protein
LLAYGNYITFRIPFDTCPCRFERRRCPPGTQHSSRHSYFKFDEVVILMLRVFILSAVVAVAILGLACGSSTNTNTNTNQSVGSGNVTVDANKLPEGLSASPVPPSANTTPGIPDPANANNVPKGATPTPGIPDPETLKKPFKPGATPTPGIPSPEELRRQLQRNVNVNAPPPASSDSTMMKSTRKNPSPVNKPE